MTGTRVSSSSSRQALGTTHADYFYGPIPCTRELTKEEVEQDYETSTGKVIVECFRSRGIDPMAVPGILVKNHGPFSWGESPAKSVYHAVVMNVLAEMAFKTLMLNPASGIGDKGRFSVSLSGKKETRDGSPSPSTRRGAGETFLCLSGF